MVDSQIRTVKSMMKAGPFFILAIFMWMVESKATKSSCVSSLKNDGPSRESGNSWMNHSKCAFCLVQSCSDRLAPNLYCLCALSFESETRNAGGKTSDVGTAGMKFPWLQKRFHRYWQILSAYISRSRIGQRGGILNTLFFNYISPLL